MQRIEWIHARLLTWGEWRVHGSVRSGGYVCPLGSMAERVGRTDGGGRMYSLIQLAGDTEVLQIDRAVAVLPEEMRRTVILAYSFEGGNDLVAQRLRITRATLHTRLCQADLRIRDWFQAHTAKCDQKNNFATYT